MQTLYDLFYLASAIGGLFLAAWLVVNGKRGKAVQAATIAALACMSAWSIAMLVAGVGSGIAGFLQSNVNLALLLLLYRLFATDDRDRSVGPVRPVVGALVLVEVMQLAMLAAGVYFAGQDQAAEMIARFAVLFRLLFCVGALVLVHNLFAGSAPQVRSALRWPAAALATVWLYDLNLYTLDYALGGAPDALHALRGAAMLGAVALIALGVVRKEGDLRFQPSRSFAFQSFSLLVIGAYLVAMVLVAQAIAWAGEEWGRSLQAAFVVAASAAALAFLPSRKLRGWVRVAMAKHLFRHRYDYRSEWLRFTDTIGRAGAGAAPLHERVVQAVADITDSPAGLLLTPRDEGGLGLDARWQWPSLDVPALAMGEDGAAFLAEQQFILDLDDVRGGKTRDIPAAAHPQWLAEEPRAWALVPLLHYERLVGVVVLARPAVARRLDWEDFDLLRVVGRQLASYLAEQASQDALGEAQRFDEFNRRMAFVMHDIKNLASQLSLLAKNAERHAEKPAFRADMIVTLRNSTDKLQALLDRLGRYGARGREARGPVRLDRLVTKICADYAARHPVSAVRAAPCTVEADAEVLEQALVHLVQNAVEASEPGSPVHFDLRAGDGEAVLEIVDSGSGMSPEFVRSSLFKPFHSSKTAGFGIGAYEARELIRAMGGRLDVESREGVGTRFVVELPLAADIPTLVRKVA